MDFTVGASGLSQGHGRNEIFSGLQLQIGVGVFGLLGPNGAGKTTLLRTLATVTPPRAGSIEILGKPIESEKDARAARRHIGFLPQDFGYYPSFSVYDFVHYSAWLREVPSKHSREETLRVIRQVGLEGRMKSRMKSLSGGMLRRAGIASALVGSPRLVLLDEPTVGLDPAQRLEFRDLIRSLENVTVILSTHLVEDVAAICNEVIVMSSGSFVFRGTPGRLSSLAPNGGIGDTPMEQGYMSILESHPAGTR
ncbi:ATP-binding cassette domain-containing protein [Streptomyces triculaminicus]|uniref:ATP-binding cassette domain-containing protein n=1 Tax=Streptomyces triculaminicus TaxID=2816232 RepID=A0A939FLF4_9ACTN|nr:ATP-binding cassette domain-containing protein [Streptomyces triculaminicus]MBO0652866.1 ATP-binding cassette domain-containing protein [Streptomyces triculaminicus]